MHPSHSTFQHAKTTKVSWAVAFFSLLGYIFFHYFVVRPDLCEGPFCGLNIGRFVWVLFLFQPFIFAAFLFLYHRSTTENQIRKMTVVGIVFRVAVLFSMPNFSDDVWRFIWDGRISTEGINPFLYTPTQILNHFGDGFGAFPGYREIYLHLNSKDYYSVYPPLLQILFAISAVAASPSVWGQTIVLKLFVLAAEIGTLFFLKKLIEEFRLPSKSILLYAINPFVISELVGNLHFEALMICGSLGALYFAAKRKDLRGAACFALAIGAKLLPLIFLPFVARRLGLKRFALFTGSCLGMVILISLPLLGAEPIRHIRESLTLYFHCFEFNDGIFRLLKHFFEPDNVCRLQEWSGRAIGAVILLSAWRERDKTLAGLSVSWLKALGFFQLCAAAVHPWYITPLVAFSSLCVFRWPLLWGFLLTFTYGFYYLPNFEQPASALWAEYILLLSFMSYELLFKSRALTLEDIMHRSSLFRSLYARTLPKRLAIREKRLMKLLVPNERIIDIGTGNGALCSALKHRGFDITPSDVKDVSFFPDVKPMLSDGRHLPFADRSFDTALLITVLHHAEDPDALLSEAARVAKKIIVMEDIHRNRPQKWFTQLTDSLVNMEFKEQTSSIMH